MTSLYSLKIDVFPHILPEKYKEALSEMLPPKSPGLAQLKVFSTLFDIERRFRVMDRFEGLVQVLTLAYPPIEVFVNQKQAVDLAKLANDGMAELVSKYPDRFVAAVACLPMNDMDAALKEVDRAIKELQFRGVQIYTPINDKPLDSPEFMPLYEKMAEYNLPIWIHPFRAETCADYKTESKSEYRIFHMFGWPYETTAAMTRLVFSGVLERYPNLKFITHHCGALIPYFEARVLLEEYNPEMVSKALENGLTKPPVEYFKMFYADTALPTTPALTCGYKFFGADHILFGTDMPYDRGSGERAVRQTINAVEQMDISELEKRKIFENNARQLLRLPL